MFDLEIISAFLGGNISAEDSSMKVTYDDDKNHAASMYAANDASYGYSALHTTNDCANTINFDSFITADGLPSINKDHRANERSQETSSNSSVDSVSGFEDIPGQFNNVADSQTGDDSWMYGYYYRDSEVRLDYGQSPDRTPETPDTDTLRQCRTIRHGTSPCYRNVDDDTSSTNGKDSYNKGGLSTCVRNGATIRERARMHMLNDAFDELRKVVPRHNVGEHQKLSKIATLRHAIQYISALAATLETSGVEPEPVKGHCVGDRRGKRRNSRKKFY